MCKRKDRNDRCDQRQYKSGEQQELLEGYVIHVITSLRDLRREKKYLLSPVKEEATATVMVYPKGSVEPKILYHKSLLLVKPFFDNSLLPKEGLSLLHKNVARQIPCWELMRRGSRSLQIRSARSDQAFCTIS